ncbi:hypothetical protein GB2207_08471 [marine gamma proteobacterium HTCC2207]|uniref:Uncharacterized protein n=1 Tax=gamma proteobacterium HTCC2207 TaxID=314287 RepID=Q1YV79_9GAMM|nr:hypothetical protein GB2207_08471 [marine gamma proteobacterium HTCC2207] [gamma proteobacterium HTCC2207]
MSDKKEQDAVASESDKDVATDTQTVDSASPEHDIPEQDIPEQDIPEQDIPEQDIPEQDIPESESSESESSESESSESESSESESSELESSQTDSSESDSSVVSSAPKEDASGSLEQLLPSVLEIAEATNNAADVSRQSSAALKKGVAQVKSQADILMLASEKSAQLASRILIGTVVALFVSVLLYSFTAVQLANRVTQVDLMLVAVSKRIVQMNSALTTFEQLRGSIEDLSATQGQFSNRQMLLIEAVSRAEVSTRSMAAEVPSLAAQQVGEKTDQIVTQVSSLSADLEGQAQIVSALTESVSALGKQMKSLQGQVGNVKQLNDDVEALITLERENYLEVLQRQVALEEVRQKEAMSEEPEPEPAPSVVTYSIRK